MRGSLCGKGDKHFILVTQGIWQVETVKITTVGRAEILDELYLQKQHYRYKAKRSTNVTFCQLTLGQETKCYSNTFNHATWYFVNRCKKKKVKIGPNFE